MASCKSSASWSRLLFIVGGLRNSASSRWPPFITYLAILTTWGSVANLKNIESSSGSKKTFKTYHWCFKASGADIRLELSVSSSLRTRSLASLEIFFHLTSSMGTAMFLLRISTAIGEEQSSFSIHLGQSVSTYLLPEWSPRQQRHGNRIKYCKEYIPATTYRPCMCSSENCFEDDYELQWPREPYTFWSRHNFSLVQSIAC